MFDDIESLMLFIVIMFDHNTSIFNILRLIGLKQDINTMVLQKKHRVVFTKIVYARFPIDLR